MGFRRTPHPDAKPADNKSADVKAGADPDKWARTIIGMPPISRVRSLASLSIEHGEKEGAPQASPEEEMFKIRLATSKDRRESASLLIQKMYSWRGYAADSPAAHDPNRITLVANQGDVMIGTLSIGFDSPSGLLADEMYKAEIDTLRAQGSQVGELIKLAVDRDLRSMQVLAALFHLAYIYGRNIHNLTDAVIEVNPRHIGFYKMMLGFELLGEEKMCPRANAPAVLLRLKADFIIRQIQKFGGLGDKARGERSLYPYFFSPDEEAGITHRLMFGR